MAPLPPFWIPPGQRKALTRPDDAQRFNTAPVDKEIDATEAAATPIPPEGAPLVVAEGLAR
jgi:hypothetical protein